MREITCSAHPTRLLTPTREDKVPPCINSLAVWEDSRGVMLRSHPAKANAKTMSLSLSLEWLCNPFNRNWLSLLLGVNGPYIIYLIPFERHRFRFCLV